MSKRVYSRENLEPWSDENDSGDFFRRVREIQLLNAPRPLASGCAQMFGGNDSLDSRLEFARRRAAKNMRDFAAIMAGATCGVLMSAIAVGVYKFLV